MKLMTNDLARSIPALYSQDGLGLDAIARVKFFCPSSSWTWYVSELDPVERTCFGLVVGHERELGYFSLDELEKVRGPMGLKIERDLHFTPCALKDVP
jgi:hypothetical protein